MATLASQVQVVRRGNERKLKVNGEDFPWLVGSNISIDVDTYDLPRVKIELLAENIQVSFTKE